MNIFGKKASPREQARETKREIRHSEVSNSSIDAEADDDDHTFFSPHCLIFCYSTSTDRIQRDIEKELRNLDRDEQKLIGEIKAAAAKGNQVNIVLHNISYAPAHSSLQPLKGVDKRYDHMLISHLFVYCVLAMTESNEDSSW